jgi:hypothetical protein
MPKPTPESILNKIFGSNNIILNSSDNSDIHVGDQNIFFDLATTSLKTACPKCHQPAEESEGEENETYKAFLCSNCGNEYYEHDLIAENVSNYIDLDSHKGKELDRLISAVNHDIKVGDFNFAYNRCITHKATYGNTPQIYEWGALTLFYNTSVDNLIKTSCAKIILYLNRSLELSKGVKSNSYREISSSIATRYFKAVYNKISLIKNTNLHLNEEDKNVLKQKEINNRIKIYSLLLELKTCYLISQDTDFAVKGLEELYGYKGIAWFERKFCSLFFKMKNVPVGFRRGLKGYAWDYHNIIDNGSVYFDDFKIKPYQLAIYFENIIIDNGLKNDLSEIRIGHFFEEPVSARANLVLISFLVHLMIMLLIALMWVYLATFIAVLAIALYIGLLYLNNKANSANIDQFRRIINIEIEGDIQNTFGEVAEELDLQELQKRVKESLKIKR